MAIAISDVQLIASGPQRFVYATVTLDSSYDNGGEAITAAALGLQSIKRAFCTPTTSGYVPRYSTSATKIVVYGTGTASATASVSVAQLSSVGDGIDLSAEAFGVLVVGI